MKVYIDRKLKTNSKGTFCGIHERDSLNQTIPKYDQD